MCTVLTGNIITDSAQYPAFFSIGIGPKRPHPRNNDSDLLTVN